MYDIHLFNNIYSEGELIAMDREYIETLGYLMDDKMGVRFLEFFDRFEKSGIRESGTNVGEWLTETVDLMHEVLDERIKMNTLHLEVKEKDLITLLYNVNLETIETSVADRDKLIEDFTWLLDNRDYWQSEIRPRQKVAFDSLLAQSGLLYQEAKMKEKLLEVHGLEVEIHAYPNLINRIKGNRTLFCGLNEKPRSTGMGRVALMRNDIEQMLHYLIYNRECDRLKMSRPARRI